MNRETANIIHKATETMMDRQKRFESLAEDYKKGLLAKDELRRLMLGK